MKIAITSMGAKLKDKVDPRFGRCHYFILFDTDTNKFEAMENTGAQGMGGVGIQSGQIMADKGVETVLTSDFTGSRYKSDNRSKWYSSRSY